MTDTERVMLLSPAATDCVYITRADSASIDLDVYVVVAEWLWLEFILVEFLPCVCSIDLEAFKSVRVNHCDLNEIKGGCRRYEFCMKYRGINGGRRKRKSKTI